MEKDKEIREALAGAIGGLVENYDFTCHICGKKRPFSKISVLTKPLLLRGKEIAQQNIRYCNDEPSCMKEAKEFSF